MVSVYRLLWAPKSMVSYLFIVFRTKPESVSLEEETKVMEERLEMVKRMMELEKEKRSVKMANSLDG
jgi:hypothetical protein